MQTLKPLLIVIVARGRTGDEDEFGRYDLSSWTKRTDVHFQEFRIKCGVDKQTGDRVYIIRPFSAKDEVFRSFDVNIGYAIKNAIPKFRSKLIAIIKGIHDADFHVDDVDFAKYDCNLLVHWGGGNSESINRNEEVFRAIWHETTQIQELKEWFVVSLSSLRKDIIDMSGGIKIPVGEELRELIKRARHYATGEIENIETIKVAAFNARYENEENEGLTDKKEFLHHCKQLGVIREEN